MKREKIAEVIAALFIILFSYAASSKLQIYNEFIIQLSKSPFLHSYAEILAWAVPGFELLIVGVLLFKRTRLLGLYASFFLMVLFTGYIYAMLNYSYDLPCSCGGVLANMTWEQHLNFNILFTLLALSGIVLESPGNRMPRILSVNFLLRNKQESR